MAALREVPPSHPPADGPPAPEAAPPGTDAAPVGRAGRNLPVALGVGLGLGGLVLVTLYAFKPAFLVVGVVAISVGMWELVRALRIKQMYAPFPPLAAGVVAILVLGYTNGIEAMTVAMLLTAVATVVWRLAEGV